VTSLAPVKAFAPAKINLALHVTGQRDDGYHLLESLVMFAKVGDWLTITPAAQDKLSFSGPFGSTLQGDAATNLVLKARDAVRRFAEHRPCPPVHIHLEKNLPLSSGIGGGSADAAATMTVLNDLWALGLSKAELMALGLPLGADVPMCLAGDPLIASGIGDIIEPVIHLPDISLLLVNPGVAVSTPQIFKALASKDNPPLLEFPSFDSQGDLLAYLASTRNDLQPPATTLCPAIDEVINSLADSGALLSRMSGSGATCFGIFADYAAAKAAATKIAMAHPNWWIA
jgi:4-diphosphocytidyl-2-C-methyl-D-erythritol kinase